MYYLKYNFCPPLRKSLLSHQYWVNSRPVAKQYSIQKSILRSFNSCKIREIKYCQHNINTITFLTRVRNPLFINTVQKHRILLIRSFKTSKPRYVHPAVWIVLRPLLKFAAVLSGRGFRKWWKDLPNDKKKYFIGVLKANINKILAAVFLMVVLSASYYQSHLEETPITKRKRFMAFNPKQLEKINEHQLNQMMEKFGPHCLPANHPATRRVAKVVNKILAANKDIEEIKDKKWGVSIVESSSENAFVLPIGHVFMFTGMMRFCSNDDQLAAILAHEIAHCLQNHGAENISYAHILDLFSIVIIAAIWAMLPSDLISLLTHWLYNKTIELFLQLPYNRKLETEADKVGLHLAAKACFDVRETSAFWSKMSTLRKTFAIDPEIEFLSTHPIHEHRAEYLDSIMDQAIKVRKDCGCPDLSYKDPRLDIVGVSRALEIARRKYLEQYPKPIIMVK